MPRRVTLPGASELFRPTGADAPDRRPATGAQDSELAAAITTPTALDTPAAGDTSPTVSTAAGLDTGAAPVAAANGRAGQGRGTGPTTSGTGRVRHEEKITVYVSRDELLALEQARLRLRGDLGLAVDRGRLVRAAVALALADLDVAGENGELVRRLTTP